MAAADPDPDRVLVLAPDECGFSTGTASLRNLTGLGMRQDNPLLLAAVTSVVVVVFFLWRGDLRQDRAGTPNPNAFPGAHPAPTSAVMLAVAGALVLLAVETGGEYAFGWVGEQSSITVLFALYSLSAAFAEELVFRGYLVVRGRGRAWFWGSVLGFSVVFALMHSFLWRFRDDWTIEFTPSLKGWFSTALAFAASLWFYAMRFQARNPTRSLVPCIAGHLAKNAGVIVIKALQGFVIGVA
jgi:CAAX protease family protein